MSPLSGNYSGSSGHMCTYETCVLRTNLTVDNFRRRFWVVADIRLVLSALSLNGLIIPLVCGGNEAAHLVQQKLDLLWSKLQLALEKEREATQAAAEATQMAEIAQDRIAKTIERERKFRASYVQAKEIAMRALKQERKCKIALILSWFFFWLCCFHVLAQVRMLE